MYPHWLVVPCGCCRCCGQVSTASVSSGASSSVGFHVPHESGLFVSGQAPASSSSLLLLLLLSRLQVGSGDGCRASRVGGGSGPASLGVEHPGWLRGVCLACGCCCCCVAVLGSVPMCPCGGSGLAPRLGCSTGGSGPAACWLWGWLWRPPVCCCCCPRGSACCRGGVVALGF